jgi:hypothetical protein
MKGLDAIIQELKAPKNRKNSFGGYNYRSCEDILEAVKPLLKKHSLSLRISDEPLLVGTYNYIKATATISDGEQTVEVSAVARETETKKGMDASQITGAASSYARKYALNGLFLIDDSQDADTQKPEDHAEQMASKKQLQEIATLATQFQGEQQAFLEKALHQPLSAKKAQDIIERASRKLDGMS